MVGFNFISFVATKNLYWSDASIVQSISGTENAYPGTPLAATLIDKENNPVVALYYASGAQELWRAVYNVTAKSWQAPQLVAHPKLHPASHLTAITDKNHNHVFYVEADNARGDYVNHHDDWSQIS